MTQLYNTIDFFDYHVFIDNLSVIQFNSTARMVINTINPHSYVVAQRDNIFKKALLSSDVLLPDGIGIIYAVRHLNKKHINRITGYDLLIFMLEYLNLSKGKCFFMGSTELVLKSIKNRINNEYPNIRVGFHSPPFKSIFDEDDDAAIINAINEFEPDILFVGMTAPKQEIWVYKNNNRLSTSAICSIGAAFDFYAGNVNRPSFYWREGGFEWLARFFKNPIKLWKRNLISLPVFVYNIIKKKII